MHHHSGIKVRFLAKVGIHLRPPIARQVYPRQESSIQHLHTNMDPVAAATNTATARGLPIEILLRVFSHLAPDACCIVLDNATREPTLRSLRRGHLTR